MSVYGNVIPGVRRLTSIIELSKKARQRLKWFDYYPSHTHNARLTCRHFDISPQTFYRSRATAITAAHFLDKLERRMPFTVKAIQVAGGLEFEATFEEECQRRGIKLFVLPPCSPKLNGYVERAHRTHTEEFYEVTESSFDIAELRGKLLEWQRTYDSIRPHQALGYLTPLKFLE